MKQNRPPTEGKQYYGMAVIDGATEVMTMSLHDLTGAVLFKIDLNPERG